MKKKIFTLFTALILSAGALFASDTAVDGIYYDFDDANLTATVTYHGFYSDSYADEYTGDLAIPATVTYGGNTYSVTSIGSSAFYKCSGLTSVTIPNSVTSIGGAAFKGCSGLTSITIPNSVTSIGDAAFEGTAWLANQPDGVIYINQSLYTYKGEMPANTSIVVRDGTTQICGYAFYGCYGLTLVTIPNSVTSIGKYAFYGCSDLTSVTIPNSVTSIGWYAFYDCSDLTSVTIPNSVTSIRDGAFYNVPNIVYSGTATGSPWGARSVNGYVEGYLVYESEAKTQLLACSSAATGEIIIPNSVTRIGEYAFSGCSGLTSVTIGNSVTSIGVRAFYECRSLPSVTIPNSVTSIGDGAFYDCSGLTSVMIGNSVMSIGSSAFSNCSGLTSVTIPNSVTSIREGAFRGCRGLTSIVVGSGNTTYDSRNGCNAIIETATNTLVVGCQSTIIPNSVTSIGSDAFKDCSGLTSVTIPNSVTSIGSYAFSGCSGLTKTNYTGDIAGWCGINFGGRRSNPTEYSHNLYINDVEVKDLVIPNGVTSIGSYVFKGCSGLTSVTIPNSVTSIGESAFSGCSGLTSVTIPNSVTSIGSWAFAECSGLTSVVWNAKNCADFAKYYDEYGNKYYYGPFYEIASQITSFTFGSAVEHIPAYLCYGMENLTSVTMPNSVTSIGEYAFGECTKLINIVCYAAEPPFVGTDPFSTYNAYLKVPCSSLDAYKAAAVWGAFNNISCIGSEEVQVTEFSVTPSTNEAQFTWPAEPNAATYELVISKDGVVFCTLTFNASGQLMGIAFAPGAGTAATTATSGFQFTVTGLNEASHYTYTFDAKDAGGSVVKHYAGEFNTGGITVGLEQIELADLYTQAGRIVCEGEFRIYDLLGRDVTRLNGSLSGVYVVKTANAAQKVVVK